MHQGTFQSEKTEQWVFQEGGAAPLVFYDTKTGKKADLAFQESLFFCTFASCYIILKILGPILINSWSCASGHWLCLFANGPTMIETNDSSLAIRVQYALHLTQRSTSDTNRRAHRS